MQGTLVPAILTIKGSYSRAIDFPLEGETDVPDTVQWWLGDGGCWRIRTYALDHDIHAYQIGDSPQTTLNLATENNAKHFGDQIKVQHVIQFLDCAEQAELRAKFQPIGLVPRLEISVGQFAFWKPDAAVYWTQSTPK
jgi:hypothetical protein